MLLLGIDLGTSSIKASVIDAATRKYISSVSYPETEADIISVHPGWAEQSPDQWWEHVKQAILKCHASGLYDPLDIAAIGVAYQMHGLVLVDKDQHVLRNAIIWCDSRAVQIGNNAFQDIGQEECLDRFLNSPGNFTASKLAWVKQNEPAVYDKADKIMLPGDFIAMKMTGDCTTTVSALSEGVLWDFKHNRVADRVLDYFGFDRQILPPVQPLFAPHGFLKENVAARLSLKAGIPVSYKAGDQPNNALSLNVLQPGDVATTAGTSGVIYGVCDQLNYDPCSRVNSFAHVNHGDAVRLGVLLCINGTGIFNRWVKQIAGSNYSYAGLNDMAASVPVGSDGLMALPFGNGAERMLHNKIIGAHFHNLDFNLHGTGHLVRAVQEGIAFAFRYGIDIMRTNGIDPAVVRAGKANLFLSKVFAQSFASVNNVAVEFYECDGSFGAAIGAGIGAGIFKSAHEALQDRAPTGVVMPNNTKRYDELYEEWKEWLNKHINKMKENSPLFSSSVV